MQQSSMLSILVAAALLSGCGGGTGSSPVTAPVAAAIAPLPASKAIATANLTVKYPATFHVAGSASSARLPQYVNPGAYYLDVFVDGVHVIAPGSPNVVGTPDGTQTFTLPIYSTAGHQVVAIESIAPLNNNYIISLGEYDIPGGSFSAGDSFAVGLTMQMSVQHVGFMTDTLGTGANIGPNINVGCPGPMPFTVTLFPFATDAAQGFTVATGLGTVTPGISSWVSRSLSPANSLTTAGTGQNGGYNITIANSDDNGVMVNLSTLNPALTIKQDVLSQAGNYPGIQSLYYGGGLSSLNNGNGISSTTNYSVNLVAGC